MVVFEHIISKGEAKHPYINLTDINGNHYRKYFPERHILISDMTGIYEATMHRCRENNQIWGGLGPWHKKHKIKEGDRIMIGHIPSTQIVYLIKMKKDEMNK